MVKFDAKMHQPGLITINFTASPIYNITNFAQYVGGLAAIFIIAQFFGSNITVFKKSRMKLGTTQELENELLGKLSGDWKH